VKEGLRRRTGRWLTAVLASVLVLGAAARPSAHEIPADVTIQVFLKPEGNLAHVIVRVPLASLLDVDWPMRNAELLDLDKISPFLYDASTLWLADNIDFFEDGSKLEYPRVVSVRASLPGDKSFDSYEDALDHVKGPALTNSTDMYRNQGTLDAMFDYKVQSAASRFAIHPKFSRLGVRVVTVLRYVLPDGAVRAFEYTGDPGTVQVDPAWYQAAFRFVQMGIEHILSGTDHLLFLFCLVIPFRKLRSLIPIVTAFTVAHSITLIASAYNMAPSALWFPPLIETLIATSIVYMALENITTIAPKRRWLITFGFGLVHGFGFSFALKQTLQFAGTHLLTSLLSFNIGVEIGQLAVLLLMVPALELLFRFVVEERMGTIIVSAIVAHTAWHWMIDRWTIFHEYPLELPVIDAAFLASALRWAMLVVALVGIVWLAQVLRRPAVKPVEVEEALN
jgi:hypothetical protein